MSAGPIPPPAATPSADGGAAGGGPVRRAPEPVPPAGPSGRGRRGAGAGRAAGTSSAARPEAARAALPPHERIVAAARELFCRDGIHATGIDRVLAEAGASKMTLYGRFGSKEALVREVLRREGEEWRATLFARLRAASPEPLGQLGHAVAALGAWFHGGRFYGCAFMNASAEHTKGEPWLRELALAHGRAVLAVLHALARDAGLREPELLARQVLLVMDGTIASLMTGGDAVVLAVAERTLQAVLRQG